MRTFAQKPKATQQTTSVKSTTPGRAHSGQSCELNSILHLQRTIDNQAAQQMRQTNSEEFNASLMSTASSRFGRDFSRIPIRSTEAGSIQRNLVFYRPGAEHFVQRLTAIIPRTNASIFRDDGMIEEEPTNEAVAAESETPMEEPTAETQQPAVETAAREPKEGETVRLPDIEPQDIPAFTIAQADPVNPTLYYTHHIEQLPLSNSCPIDDTDGLPKAGLTNALPVSVINVSVTPLLGWYFVDATLDEKITYQVCDGVGPQGQVDITSIDDPDITKENYLEVAQDLTPDAQGMPSRRLYYASDLTLRHERFHATEWAKVAQQSVPDAQKWLMGKTASSVFGVNFLLEDLSKQFMKIVGDKVRPGAEDRAYGDGKSLYLSLSKAIIAKGDAGGYPKWDRKKGLP